MAESGVEPEGRVGIEGRKGAAGWGYGEGVEGLVPDGQEPSNVFENC